MTAVIQTERLTKSYGIHRGIVELDLDVQEGEVFGFLGPNGAGETTTMRVYKHLGQPMAGVFDPAGIVAAAVMVVGGLAICAIGLTRRDIGR